MHVGTLKSGKCLWDGDAIDSTMEGVGPNPSIVVHSLAFDSLLTINTRRKMNSFPNRSDPTTAYRYIINSSSIAVVAVFGSGDTFLCYLSICFCLFVYLILFVDVWFVCLDLAVCGVCARIVLSDAVSLIVAQNARKIASPAILKLWF